MAKSGKGGDKGRGENSGQGATSKLVNCQLPGADLVAEGKSATDAVEEVERKKRGRPSDKTPELVDSILTLLMEGVSLVKICKREEMPSYPTVCAWLAKDADFLNRYTKAREVQADYLADEILDIADDATHDEVLTDDGKRFCNNEFVQRSKLRVDARKWVAAKLLPKKYGDKITHAGDEDNPLVVKHKHQLTEEELLAIAAGSSN